MLLSALWFLVSAALVTSKSLPDIPLVKPEDLTAKEVKQGGFIVQLKKDASLVNRLGKRSPHEQFRKRADLGLDYTIRTEFTNPGLFWGLSIQLDQNKTIDDVKAILDDHPEVTAVWPIRKVTKPSPISASGTNSTLASAISSAAAAVGSWTPVDDSPILPLIKGANVLSTHKMADVDKLHAKGIKGKGIKIGLVDSGVDYRHPALGGGFGPGFKVAGGYSFMDDDFYGVGTPVESPDPLGICAGVEHGTHTSGIIGAEDPEDIGFGLTGVAPEANLYMYKVFGCTFGDTTYDETIMKGMIKAVEDGVDIISMSLGFTSYFLANSPFNDLIKAIISQGVGLVVSNGNNGKYGIYAESSPADSTGVIGVGSITNDVFPVAYTFEDSLGESFQYGSVWPLDASEMNVYYHGSSCDYGAWQATGSTIQASGAENTIVIAEIGGNIPIAGCAIDHQLIFASYFGVQNLITYNLDSLDPSPFAQDIEAYLPLASINSLLVTPSTGAKLVKNVLADPSYKLKFISPAASSIPLVTGGLMSNFSSFGPSWDTLEVRPTVSAPGGKILSTWPLGPSGGYAIISGTSMSAPFVAGCYALVKSQFPDLSVAEIGNLLQSTATPVSYVYDKSILSSVAHQGSGMVNPYKAITYGTLVTSSVSLGDLDDFERTPHTITITNKATSGKKVFQITHQGAGYAEVFPYPYPQLEPNDYNLFGQPQFATFATARFSQTRITVHAGETLEFRAYITQPKLTDAQLAKQPLISGFFQLTSDTETHTIPYLGIPYSRQEEYGIDTSVYNWVDYDGTQHSAAQPFVYCGSCTNRGPNTGYAEYNGTDWHFATMWFNFLTGIQHFQTNIVPANTTFKPTHHGGNPPKNSGYKYLDPGITPHDTWKGIPSYGWIPDNTQYNNYAPSEDTPFHYPYQGYSPFLWGAAWYDKILEDGETFEYLPNGDYRLLISLLKPGSDYDDWSQWETYLSPVIRLVGDNF